jgi:hypothetical protein
MNSEFSPRLPKRINCLLKDGVFKFKYKNRLNGSLTCNSFFIKKKAQTIVWAFPLYELNNQISFFIDSSILNPVLL